MKNNIETKRILITAGPTNEYIDEVMKITNMSTGRLGIELTKRFLEEGSKVTLIATRSVIRSGLYEKYNLKDSQNVKSISIETTKDMYNVLEEESKNKYDLVIHHQRSVTINQNLVLEWKIWPRK